MQGADDILKYSAIRHTLKEYTNFQNPNNYMEGSGSATIK